MATITRTYETFTVLFARGTRVSGFDTETEAAEYLGSQAGEVERSTFDVTLDRDLAHRYAAYWVVCDEYASGPRTTPAMPPHPTWRPSTAGTSTRSSRLLRSLVRFSTRRGNFPPSPAPRRAPAPRGPGLFLFFLFSFSLLTPTGRTTP